MLRSVFLRFILSKRRCEHAVLSMMRLSSNQADAQSLTPKQEKKKKKKAKKKRKKREQDGCAVTLGLLVTYC